MTKKYKKFFSEAEMASEREKFLLPDELEEARRQTWRTMSEECQYGTPTAPLGWGYASFYGSEKNPYGDGREDWDPDDLGLD